MYVLTMVLCKYSRFQQTSIYHEYTRTISAVRQLLPKSHPRTNKTTNRKACLLMVLCMYSRWFCARTHDFCGPPYTTSTLAPFLQFVDCFRSRIRVQKNTPSCKRKLLRVLCTICTHDFCGHPCTASTLAPPKTTKLQKKIAEGFVYNMYSRFLRTSMYHEYTCVLPPVRRLLTSQPNRRLSSSRNPRTSVFTELLLLSLFLMSQDAKLSEV